MKLFLLIVYLIHNYFINDLIKNYTIYNRNKEALKILETKKSLIHKKSIQIKIKAVVKAQKTIQKQITNNHN